MLLDAVYQRAMGDVWVEGVSQQVKGRLVVTRGLELTGFSGLGLMMPPNSVNPRQFLRYGGRQRIQIDHEPTRRRGIKESPTWETLGRDVPLKSLCGPTERTN